MGKLIVLEGTDGCGKSTQVRLLTERLSKEGKDFRQLRFPRYDQESSALIRLYLGGAFGQDPNAVNAYAASTFYAVDRYASYLQDWGSYYRSGGVLIADRYTTSNAIHQGGKLPEGEKHDFLRWLEELEYERMELPRPDRVLWLNMPVEQTLILMQYRQCTGGGPADIHELDEEYLRHCYDTARDTAHFCGWTTIDCVRNGVIRPAEEIASEIYTTVLDCMEE